jgi:hypothetical protein
MSFLSTAFLIALPLVVVPIAIHLYRGKQRDVIMWGAMQFLATAVTKGRRMERLEELLLMALRLAAVAALVLALARPMIRSSWLGDATDREVILVLDNSLSMSRELDGESSTDRLREHADEVVDSLSNADAVQVMLAAGPEWITAEGIAANTTGKQRLREIVEGVEPTQGSADLLKCLQSATHLQATDQLTARRVIVFTDSQASNWQVEPDGPWRQLSAERDAAQFPISLEVVDCGFEAGEIDNLAVTDLKVVKSLVRPGEHIELMADITNVGDVRSESSRVQWLVDGKVAEESPLKALEPRATTQATAALRMEEGGVFSVTCRIESTDQVPLDQEESIIVEVADQLPILFVESDADTGSVSAAELIDAALGYKESEAQNWHSVFRPEVIPTATLAAHPLAEYRAILINNPGELGRATIERLDAFVRGGGGLWIALGDQAERVSFNRDWYADGDGLSPLELESLMVIDKPDDPAASIHPPSRDHFATGQLANTTQLDIDEARIRQRWLFRQQRSEADTVSALLESGNGQPLVVENYLGQGRVLVQSYPLGLEWSNLPLLKSYVVMIQDWLDYVTAPTIARFNLTPGAPIVVSGTAGAHDAVELVTPRGTSISLVAPDADVAPVYRYSQTWLPGTYRVRFKKGERAERDVPFQVARDESETDLRALTDPERAKLSAAGVGFGTAPAIVSNTEQAAPRREPFWGVLLAALVALLAGELLLSSGLARQRHGLAVSAH